MRRGLFIRCSRGCCVLGRGGVGGHVGGSGRGSGQSGASRAGDAHAMADIERDRRARLSRSLWPGTVVADDPFTG
jgi:hypothetical protein